MGSLGREDGAMAGVEEGVVFQVGDGGGGDVEGGGGRVGVEAGGGGAEDLEQRLPVGIVEAWGQVGRRYVACAAVDDDAGADGWGFFVHRVLHCDRVVLFVDRWKGQGEDGEMVYLTLADGSYGRL